MKPLSRRNFLGEASCAAVGSSSLFSTLLNLRMTNTAASYRPGHQLISNSNDYKALVCIFLAGGNDSFNMLLPGDDVSYAEYKKIRADLALAKDSLLPLDARDVDGKSYALHPSMPEVQKLFNDGSVAFVSNVGTLVEPTTLQSYENGSAKLPVGLYSHSDQIMHWQTSVPDSRSALGWGGRTADLLHMLNDNQNISMNISLSGSNMFQAGNSVVEYAISSEANGSVGIEGFRERGMFNQLRTSAIESMLDLQYQNLFEQTFAAKTKNAISAQEQFSKAIAGLDPFSTTFSENEISTSLQMVARTIKARKALGMRRQTFFVMFGGWDHHDEVLNNQTAMLGVLSRAMSEFYDSLKEMELENNVTTFTASDFGRTLTSNGQGSDHAWGGNHMVMGGAVQGGKFYGQYPDLYAGNKLDTGRGRLIPSTSCDEYFAELALWFGVEPGDLDAVFPNIHRFYTSGSSLSPLGYMQIHSQQAVS